MRKPRRLSAIRGALKSRSEWPLVVTFCWLPVIPRNVCRGRRTRWRGVERRIAAVVGRCPARREAICLSSVWLLPVRTWLLSIWLSIATAAAITLLVM